MEMPTPTKEHKKLELLTGNWSGTEKLHPSQWDPEGGEAEGKSQSRLSLDGFVVLTDYEQHRDGQRTFAGHGVWTYDKQEEEVILYWFDTMGLPPNIFRGGWEGETLVMLDTNSRMQSRLSYDFSESGKMLTKMEMSPDGKEWMVLFDGEYRK